MKNNTNTKGVFYTPCVRVTYKGHANRRGSRVILSLPNHDSETRRPTTFSYDYEIGDVERMAINWLSEAGFDIVGYTSDKKNILILVTWKNLDLEALWSNLKKVSKK